MRVTSMAAPGVLRRSPLRLHPDAVRSSCLLLTQDTCAAESSLCRPIARATTAVERDRRWVLVVRRIRFSDQVWWSGRQTFVAIRRDFVEWHDQHGLI